MKVFKPPLTCRRTKGVASVFLAGSIEMGNAEDWQTKVENALAEEDVIVFNPRRDDWDSSWEQTLEDDRFRGQVQWEHDYLTTATVVFFYFDPATKSPISLMELGLVAPDREVIVVCPDGFWRKGNVEFICEEYDIPLFDILDDGIEVLLQRLQ